MPDTYRYPMTVYRGAVPPPNWDALWLDETGNKPVVRIWHNNKWTPLATEIEEPPPA